MNQPSNESPRKRFNMELQRFAWSLTLVTAQLLHSCVQWLQEYVARLLSQTTESKELKKPV